MATATPYVFGAGIVWGVQLQDSAGNTIATPTPYRLGVLQSMNLEFSTPVDDLYGSYQYPLATGRKTGKITAKCKFAQYDAGSLNALFFGAPSNPVENSTTNTTTANQQVVIVNDEAQSVPGSSTYTVTVTNSATFVADLGVRYGNGATTGVPGTPLQHVASLTAAGQYTYSAGVYTFDAADASAPVLIDYTYNPSAGNYWTLAVNNYLLGAQPLIQLYGKTTYGSTQQKVGFTFFQVTTDTMSLPTKLDGFAIGDLNFDIFSNLANGIGTLTFQYL